MTIAWRAIPTAAGEVLRRAWDAVDARDLQFYGGLALAGAGGTRISGPWTCVAIGAVLVLHAVLAGPLAAWTAKRGGG